MGSDIELGMDQQTVLQALGLLTQQWNTSLDGMSETFSWESICFSEKVYRRATVIKIHKRRGVTRMDVCNTVFGWSYLSTLQ
ncbi:MAG TPA: hypothetical protein PLN21_15980 [Gemmatales bacterium]|nr:hypothetical protein [Gemmatales bacterium]